MRWVLVTSYCYGLNTHLLSAALMLTFNHHYHGLKRYMEEVTLPYALLLFW